MAVIVDGNSIDVTDIFKNDKLYHNHIDPINDYISQASDYISKIYNIDKDIVTEKVKEVLKEDKNIKNPKVKYRERDENGDVNYHTTSLTGYINYVKSKQHIMVPSFTVYFNPKIKKSLHSEFISYNVKERSKHKKLAFKYKMEGDIAKFNYHNTLQKTMKIFNNSLSGAYASSGTILYSPSNHYTLTSITRCVSGIGNAVSESMITGNLHFRNPDITLNHIVAVIDNMDKESIIKVIDSYNLNIPTTEEIMDNLVIKNISRYWRDPISENKIAKYIDGLDKYEKAYLMYHNNLWAIREFNPTFMKQVIKEFLSYKEETLEHDPIEILKNTPEWIINLISHIAMDMLRGKKLVYEELDRDIVVNLAKASIRSVRIFNRLEDFIKVFFATTVFPPSISYIKDMIRDNIVLSDTDSTCATYQDWAKWWAGDYIINQETVAIAAIVMTFNTQAIDHYIKLFGTNMNISPDKASILKMKNEFFWDVFCNTDVAKHYFAQVRIQEGNVYAEPDLEMKGVNLIASQVHESIRKLEKWMMLDIMDKTSKNEKLPLGFYLDKVADMELYIKEMVDNGDADIFKLQKVKDANSYKNGPGNSPYIHYIIWQELFADKYGQAPEPTYFGIKINTTINNKSDMNEWMEKYLSNEQRVKLVNIMKKYNKKEISTFVVPLVNAKDKGIPQELKSIIDVDKIITDNCIPLYMVLTSIGFYRKPGQKIYELINKTTRS